MYLAIGALLQFSYLVSSSPLHELALGPVSQLYKRDWVHECDDRPWITSRFHSSGMGREFSSITEFCTGYPHGIGLVCNADGGAEQREPESMTSQVYGGSWDFCTRLCYCRNIAPDIPSQEEEAPIGRISDCTTSSDDGTIGDVDEQPSSSSTCSYPEPTVRANADESACNEYWYGRPNNQDCQQAMLGLPDQGATERRFREVLPMGAMSQLTSSTWPPIRTPLILTHGHCVLAVLLVPLPSGLSETMGLNTLALNDKAEYLRRKCVQSEGIGGWLTMKQITPPLSTYSPRLTISLFAPDSKQKDFLDLKYRCMVDNSGSVKCKPPLPEPKSTTQHEADGKQDGTAVPKGSKQACSGSCYNPTECDINSDCICTAPDIGIPLSSSWGQHSCRYVAGAAAAIAAAAIAPKRCRGRCLLFEDGTLDIDKPTNASNTTQLSSNISIPNSLSTSKDNSTALLSNDTANLEIGRFPTISSNSENSLYKNASNSPLKYATFNDSQSARPPAILYCPCNCTYVSAACCLSATVYEDPSMQIYMDPLSADSSVCCDPNSGLWLSTPSKKCSRHRSSLSGTDFIGLGSVRWNRSATLPLGDSNSEDNSR